MHPIITKDKLINYINEYHVTEYTSFYPFAAIDLWLLTSQLVHQISTDPLHLLQTTLEHSLCPHPHSQCNQTFLSQNDLLVSNQSGFKSGYFTKIAQLTCGHLKMWENLHLSPQSLYCSPESSLQPRTTRTVLGWFKS